ncbi:hypothetical protein [Curtobacterium sp. 9128]|uniref:hypothetical protein n=1 Tax=Curtobacterium sp. 9128 TaxID=1793722 RepID=UPI0016425716|nr:hypothetical protein [Curtobacterium sp. 9128]
MEVVTSSLHVDDAAAAVVAPLGWRAVVWNVEDDDPAAGTEWVSGFAAAVDGPVPRVKQGGDPGRPVSNRPVRVLGFARRWSTWRTGFACL